MSRKAIKSAVAIFIVVATIFAFAYYIINHPESIQQLRKLPIATLVVLLFLYGLFMLALGWVQRVTLALCDIKLGRKESMLLVSYSSIINFFGPLQSGPAFRGAYLKRKHNVSLKKYAVATLLYYGFYALFSALFLMTYFIGLAALFGAVLIILAAPLILLVPQLIPARFRKLKLEHIGQMASAALAQVTILFVIFYIELNSLGNTVAAVPALIYTGAANFALFVSITPGAIGFREAFVLFTQKLHHIPSDVIVTASLIDRGVYILFLGILAAIVFGLHAQNYLKPKDK